MARNLYDCVNCGPAEYEFRAGFPPKECERCGLKLNLLISPNQFYIGGESTWLTERMKDTIAMQLGERPRDKEHLREIEKRKKVVRATKRDFISAPDGDKPDPKPGWLSKKMQEARSIRVRGNP